MVRSSLIVGGASVLSNLIGCAQESGPASDEGAGALTTGSYGNGNGDFVVPSAEELASSEKARAALRETVMKVVGHGVPKNRREIHRLIESMSLSEKGVGHFAFTIPGNSLEHIKVATQLFAEEFGIGPFFVLESDASVGQHYYPIDSTTGRRVGEDGKQKLDWPAYTALCKANRDYYIELNLQTSDTPSTYRDMFTSKTGGFHHFAVITHNFAKDKTVMDARFQPSSSLITNVGAIYYDARKDVGAMFELLETNAFLDFLFESTYLMSISADLKDYEKNVQYQACRHLETTGIARSHRTPNLVAHSVGRGRGSAERAAAETRYLDSVLIASLTPRCRTQLVTAPLSKHV